MIMFAWILRKQRAISYALSNVVQLAEGLLRLFEVFKGLLGSLHLMHAIRNPRFPTIKFSGRTLVDSSDMWCCVYRYNKNLDQGDSTTIG